MLRLDLAYYEKNADDSILARMNVELSQYSTGIGDPIGYIMSTLAKFIVSLIIAFAKGWKLGIVLFACMPLMYACGLVMMRMNAKMSNRCSQQYAKCAAIADQALAGIRTVHSFSLQERFAHKYAALCDTLLQDERRAFVVLGTGNGIFLSLIFAIFGLAFWYGTRLVLDGTLAVNDMCVVLFLMMLAMMSFMQLPQHLAALAAASGALTAVETLLDQPSLTKVVRNDDGKEDVVIEENVHVDFSSIYFNYPARPDVPVLQDYSLQIHRGETIAFVGASGSGKSTLLGLLQRFYEPSRGVVRLNGRPVDAYTPEALRQEIGLVGQEPVLFDLSVEQNILMGGGLAQQTQKIPRQTLIDVCKMAECHHFIEALPNGYDTPIGSSMLSGGQKQRIAIARALIKDPKILLLDEATSALDVNSEKLVQRALEKASVGRTTIIIAHRLSTIRHADRIIVMNKGERVQEGNHDTLMQETDGIYWHLVHQQMAATHLAASSSISHGVPDPMIVTEGSSTHAISVREAPFLNAAARPLSKADATAGVEMSTKHEIDSKQDQLLALRKRESLESLARQRRSGAKEGRKVAKASFKASAINVPGRVKAWMRGHHWRLYLGVVASTLSGFTFPIFAFCLGQMIGVLLGDRSKIAPGPLRGAYLYCFIFALLAVYSFLVTFSHTCFFGYAEAHFNRTLRARLFEFFLEKEIAYFDDQLNNSVGALNQRLSAVSEAPKIITRVWGPFAAVILTAVAGIGLAFGYSVRVAAMLLVFLPVLLYSMGWQLYSATQYAEKSNASFEAANKIQMESIRDLKTVVSLGQEQFFETRVAAELAYPRQLAIRYAYIDAIAYALRDATMMFTVAVGLKMGGKVVDDGSSDFGKVLAAIVGFLVSVWAIGQSSAFVNARVRGRHAATNLLRQLCSSEGGETSRLSKEAKETQSQAPTHDNKCEVNPPSDVPIEIQSLAFAYPTRPDTKLFDGAFSLAFPASTSTALVGPSGCGKSSIIGLLQKWYQPTGGLILVDGKDIQSWDTRTLRQQMALVGQEPTLFDFTIKENIAWGNDAEVTQQQIENAATQAGIHTFIESLPEKYETKVGAKGGQLSGGQKQRIAIARALIRSPRILLLDEATSALDSRSEKEIQAALDVVSAGRTTISIAHRLSAIQTCEQIAVLSDGKVTELGNHATLLAKGGAYSMLCSAGAH